MRRRLLLPVLLALVAALMCVPGIALAADWEANDFTFDGTTVTGLSDAGKEKVAENPALVLPTVNVDGEAVTAIAQMAFRLTDGITSVTIPEGYTTMGNAAFNSCNKLEAISLPSTLTAIPTGAFLINDTAAKGIADVVIPEGVTSIGANAFSGAQVKTLSLPSTLTTIGNSAFLNHQLSELDVPVGVTALGTSVFSIAREDLPKTLAKLTLHEGLTSIGSYAFRNCAVDPVALPESVTTLNAKAFDGAENPVILLCSNADQVAATGSYAGIKTSSYHTLQYSALVTFDAGEGATVEPASLRANAAKQLDSLPEPTRDGYEFVAWLDAEGNPAKADAVYEEDATLKAQWAPSIAKAKVTAAKQTYTGKALKPEPKVELDGKVLVKGTDYTVAHKDNKSAGKATITVTGAGEYVGTATGTFIIAKAANTITVKAKTATVKASKVKKAKVKLGVSKVLGISKAKGAKTYTKVSGNKKITINKKTGQVTVKKGLKKGTYKVKVKVKAAGTGDYKSKTVTKTFKVKVK